jgi:hypothetical protein
VRRTGRNQAERERRDQRQRCSEGQDTRIEERRQRRQRHDAWEKPDADVGEREPADAAHSGQ